MRDTVVIGAGISGLTAGFLLSRSGYDVTLLERQPEPGGNIRTLAVDGFRLETGPHSVMGSADHVWRLAEESGLLGLAERAAAASDARYIYRDGRLLPLPLSFSSFVLSPLLGLRAKLRLMLEPFRPGGARELDTAWEFFERRFGREAATYIMGPFISGIYAGDPRRIGARASFPKFWNFERESGSMIVGAIRFMIAKRRRLRAEGRTARTGLWSFSGGLGSLTVGLAGQLGSRVETGVAATAIVRRETGFEVLAEDGRSFPARTVVVAAPPPEAARLVGPLAPGAVRPLAEVPMAPVAVAHWSHPAAPPALPTGFGFLMPRLYPLRVLGTLFPSELFSGRAPQGERLFASFYGGMLDPAAADLDEPALSALTAAEHGRIFGAGLDRFRLLKLLRYPAAIPQLLPDHPERIGEAARAVAAVPGLALAGNYLTGVGVEHAVQSGYGAAAAIEACTGRPGGAA